VKIAIGSDERTHLTDLLVEELTRRGHDVLPFGPLAPGDAEVDWPLVSSNVARAVAAGEADEGIVCCWTGTGASIAANKTPGIRAALCHDAETARGARLESRQRACPQPACHSRGRRQRNSRRLVRHALL
jgi:ribose 5-phosphate isomerase B